MKEWSWFSVLWLAFCAVPAADAAPSPLSCTAGTVPAVVRSEGLAERLGDIALDCSGGVPGGTLTGNLTVSLPVRITNKPASDNTVDALFTAGGGTDPVVTGQRATLLSATTIAFNGINVTIPESGRLALRISNLRAAVNQLPPGQTVLATLGFNGASTVTIQNSPLPVGTPNRGLLASSPSIPIYCVGSKLPANISLPEFFAAGTVFYSLRVTEGFADAFQARIPLADTGTRILVRYSGFPQGARVFVPDFLAGSSAAMQTAGGDLGAPPSGGQYVPGSRTLLLARVLVADANGAGGTLIGNPAQGGAPVSFNAAHEVDLVNGAGQAVYEVVDANPSVLESAQLPTFVSYNPVNDGTVTVAKEEIFLAPVSTVAEATLSAPVPRYAAVAPGSDCSALRDCNAEYFPRLAVYADSLSGSAAAGGGYIVRYVRILNEGGAILNWTASVAYKTGSGWVRIDRTSGFNNATIRIDLLPEKLTPGTYEATLTIDAGPLAGSRQLPISFVVGQPANRPPTQPPPGPPQAPDVTLRSVVNAATLREGAVAPGSVVSVFGENFTGQAVSVTFDGVAGQVLQKSGEKLNVLVPELAGKTSAQVVVNVDGKASAAQAITLAPVAPGIFIVYNEDYTVNSAANGAAPGSVIHVFATGLPTGAAGTITGMVHDREPVPDYAGPASDLPGIQLISLRVAEDLPAMTTDVWVCGAPAAAPAGRVCTSARVTLR